MSELKQLQTLHESVKSVFTWQSDLQTFGKIDHWQDFAKEVREGTQVKRDCDDFALTCALIGIEDFGLPASNWIIARVHSGSAPMDRQFDHAIALYSSPGIGYRIVLDNIQPSPIRAGLLNYQWYDWCRVGSDFGKFKLFKGGEIWNKQGHW